MPDDLTRKRPEDPQKINVNQSWEVDYWTDKLNVSENELKKIVKKVGPSTDKVRKELEK